MDFASCIGIFFGVAMILLGQALEGGSAKQIMQVTAAIIVIGGTIGAVMLQFSPKKLIGSVLGLKAVFLGVKTDPVGLILQIVDFSKRARREGILALEQEVGKVPDPFLSRALRLAVDGLEPKTISESMEIEMQHIEEEWKHKAEVWEAAGGYLPTVGIIGAVLGLIVVMQNLSDITKVGHGIAVAFVATVYGVGAANLISLPIAGKLKACGKELVVSKDMALRGVLLIQEGANHTVIAEALKGFLDEKALKRFEALVESAEKK
ncbi:MAG: flagellar motor protein [Candidatus Sumerlaeota bacterium]|nr:flagellar motor protein [Candidatus Sumerlaeota bacterium]